MTDEERTVCPIPYLGYCIYERCNFWDEERQECSGLCFGDMEDITAPDSPCAIHWTEDYD
jgi:hypothetical protein